MFIIMPWAVDYSFFKSRDYSGANPLCPHQLWTKSLLKNSPWTPRHTTSLRATDWKTPIQPINLKPFFSVTEACFSFAATSLFQEVLWSVWTHTSVFLSCNFRCTRCSWDRQGWPKRRTWGDRNPRHPRGVRTEGPLWATRTLWPINLFKQNSSSLHVQREEVSKLQKSLKSQLTDKLQIPSCYQDSVLGLLQSSRCGWCSNVSNWKHRFQETTQRETETRHRCRILYRCLILWFYDRSSVSSWGQVCGTISVPYKILKPPTHQHAHTRVINSNKGTTLISSFACTLSKPG